MNSPSCSCCLKYHKFYSKALFVVTNSAPCSITLLKLVKILVTILNVAPSVPLAICWKNWVPDIVGSPTITGPIGPPKGLTGTTYHIPELIVSPEANRFIKSNPKVKVSGILLGLKDSIGGSCSVQGIA